MSNLNAQSVQLQGTLYIGFPKTFSCAHMEKLVDEISDYIDNNCDLTLADLQADSDYAQLQFQQHMPTLADKTNFFFMDVEIYVATLKENFGHTSVLDQVTSVNIFGKNVHGDIRHLEIKILKVLNLMLVHGDIRHLEIIESQIALVLTVHGDIRHLESKDIPAFIDDNVHGDIRHLEISNQTRHWRS